MFKTLKLTEDDLKAIHKNVCLCSDSGIKRNMTTDDGLNIKIYVMGDNNPIVRIDITRLKEE